MRSAGGMWSGASATTPAQVADDRFVRDDGRDEPFAPMDQPMRDSVRQPASGNRSTSAASPPTGSEVSAAVRGRSSDHPR